MAAFPTSSWLPRLPFRGSDAIPLADAGTFAPEARRTTIARAVLGTLLAALLAAAFYVALRLDDPKTPLLQPGTNVVVVLDLSASIDLTLYHRLAGALDELASSDGRVGLVLFSSEAYEALPPATEASALRSFTRFFKRAASGGFLENPWALQFRGGTRITAGLEEAHAILKRDRIQDAGVLLISDLVDNEADSERLTRVLLAYEHDGIDLRILPLSRGGSRGLFARVLGEDVFVEAPDTDRPATKQRRVSAAGSSPLPLVIAGLLLLAVLAGNEHLCARLRWRRRDRGEPA